MRKTHLEGSASNVGPERKKKRGRVGAVIFVAIAVLASLFLWRSTHLSQLRSNMESHFSDAIANIEQGSLGAALIEAVEAQALAHRLRDSGFLYEVNAQIMLIEEVIRGNELFDSGRYQAALDAYLSASGYAAAVRDIGSGFIDDMISAAEGRIHFYGLIERAENFAELIDYDMALSLYEEARAAASALSFIDGAELAAAGIAGVHERIAVAKRAEAEYLLTQGRLSFQSGFYPTSIAFFQGALDLFRELGDEEGATVAEAWLNSAEHRLEDVQQEGQAADGAPQGDLQQDAEAAQNGDASNYEHNRSVFFDMETLIDNQNLKPATLIRMGTTEGMNEGWYNGCGWVATYNALIILGDPHHPADIVRHFETRGGTVLGGVLGTFPHAIERYFSDSGYDAGHALFPQINTDIDSAIRSSRVSILAYMHTRSAHYIAIEYRPEDGKFIVYNDSFARARSASLGLENYSDEGAAVDSIAALLQNTPEILFAFSLITIS